MMLISQQQMTIYMVTLLLNSTDRYIYINNTEVDHTSLSNFDLTAPADSEIYIFSRGDEGETLDEAIVDEFGIWNRTISTTDISDLWNNGNGEGLSSYLNIDLNSPNDGTTSALETITFNATLTPTNTNITNATLYIWNSTGIFNNTETETYTNQNGSLTETWNITGWDIGDYEWNVYGCYENSTDFINCTWANNNYSLTYGLIENSQTYESSIIEGDTSEFIVNVSYPDGYVATGTLIYNNTEYSGTKEENGGWAIFRRNVTAPGVDTQTNKSFYWKIGLTDVSGTTYYNLTTYNQTVNIMNMSEFGNPYTIPYINFTVYDEETLEEVNATIDAVFTYVPEGGEVSNTFSYSDTTENNSRWSFAIDPSDETYTIDTVIELDSSGYTHRFYNFQGLDFTNDTSEIDLYLLNDTISTSFIVSVKDTSYAPLTHVEVYMQRYYPSMDSWETVEITETNGDGRTLQHIYTENTQYRFKIYRDGEHLYTSAGTIIYCEDTPCEVEVIVAEDFDFIIPNFEDLPDLESSIEYDEDNQKVIFEYSDTSGKFTQARLYVYEWQGGKASTGYICNSTSSSSTAVLECHLSSELNGTYVGAGYITRNGDEVLTDRIIFNKIRDIVGTIGLDGVLWSMFLLVGIVMLGVYRPSLGIVFAIIGVIGLWALQLMEIPITAIVAIAGIGIILLVEVKRQ